LLARAHSALDAYHAIVRRKLHRAVLDALVHADQFIVCDSRDSPSVLQNCRAAAFRQRVT
jgi:hypothetical protein